MGTVDATEGAPSGEQATQDRSDASLEKRAVRRQKRKRENTEQCNWELMSLLASVSAEVEDIANEARTCTRCSCTPVTSTHTGYTLALHVDNSGCPGNRCGAL